MNFKKKIITKMPLEKIWDNNGYVAHKLKSYIAPKEVASRISSNELTFVIASIGSRPEFIKLDANDNYWLETIKPHLADPDGFYLDDFPGSFAFVSSEWITENSTIILLELHH